MRQEAIQPPADAEVDVMARILAEEDGYGPNDRREAICSTDDQPVWLDYRPRAQRILTALAAHRVEEAPLGRLARI